MGVLKIKSGGVWVPVAQGVGISSPGYVGEAAASAQQLGMGSTATDITGCAVTFNALAGHIYRVWLYIPRLVQNTAAGEQRAMIRNAANATLAQNSQGVPAGQSQHHNVVTYQGNLAAGSQTVKASVLTLAGTCDTTSGFLPRLFVEDVSPATVAGLGQTGAQPFVAPWIAVSSYPMEYRVEGNRVWISGRVANGSGVAANNNNPFGTLPAHIRPSRTMTFPAYLDDVSLGYVKGVTCVALPDGTFRLGAGWPVAAGVNVIFDGAANWHMV